MTSSMFPFGVLFEADEFNSKLTKPIIENRQVTKKKYQVKLVWRNIIGLIFIHACALYGLYLAFTSAKMATNLFAIFLFEITAIGITAGVHRLWSHRSYKAKWPLKLILVFLNNMAFQGHIILWARDHRTHHKYSDTDADPHNANRGFFFAHIGWLCVRKHPDVIEKGKGIDMSDLYADPILRFQKMCYYEVLMPLCCYVLPTVVAVYGWNEGWPNAFFIAGFLRHVCMLHNTFLVNSAAHLYGYKPYDKNILPVQNFTVAIMAVGEGWHNYHHTFPWDYKASELKNYRANFTNAFIDFFAWIGWAYDLKTVSPDIIKNRVQRTGDGSHELWGWGDKDIRKEDEDATITT
ncbi:acyl-CoA Delta-9 desaturase-like [Phymastichus coffea]|uniref:acyl-CoA Delta-9 desaturase-like n=1 Tax=Phymastichus coffea TaxID=108790 RepID=UPI00273B9E3B|nr:acyl-CoA Delta-9 desaturase-like [Phymastichus coffea]